METFGQKLTQALALSGLRLEDVATATGLNVEHLRALARDDFSALPDDDLVTRGLQSVARLLEVDPDQVIADFRRERQRHARQPGPQPSERKGGRAAAIAFSALVILAAAIMAFLFWPRGSQEPGAGPATAAAQVPAPRKEAAVETVGPPAAGGSVPRPAPARPNGTTRPTLPPRPSGPAIERRIGASRLSIPEYGVGKGIVDHDLVGETGRFVEGERVWFWTRLEGGAAGETIDHVWIHAGREALRVPIRLGGARWRAHSCKVLNAGAAGTWVVEARDRTGRVLARREFSCVARREATD